LRGHAVAALAVRIASPSRVQLKYQPRVFYIKGNVQKMIRLAGRPEAEVAKGSCVISRCVAVSDHILEGIQGKKQGKSGK
jgi:hypothetical protein